MQSELTPAVARAVDAARGFALRRRAAEVLPLDLLHGLLAEEEGRAAMLAAAAGLDTAAFNASFLAHEEPLPSQPSEAPLHPRTQSALTLARELAGDLFGERSIVSEALLLALIRGEDTLAAHLQPFGLCIAELETQILSQRQPPPRLDEPLRLADVTERIDVGRILDASANRAREGLRVVEDYCRFALDDAFLTRSLKELRHDLTSALAELSPDLLLEARDTQHDVGTELATPAEFERASLREAAQANLKRLQESLRSLEEFGKVHSPRLGLAVEQLRYRAYTLERALVLGAAARRRLEGVRLYVLLSAAQCTAALDWTIAEAAAGGVGMVQLREKNLGDRELLERARQVRRWTRRAGVLFIVNDRSDIARLVDADGVHLGQDDMPVREARRILGPDALIGVSTHTPEQVRRAILDGASYLGVGPTFPSGTKEFAELLGPSFVQQALAETTLPAFVIGGVNADTIAAAVAAGARRIAVSQAVARAEDPRAAAAALLAALPKEGD